MVSKNTDVTTYQVTPSPMIHSDGGEALERYVIDNLKRVEKAIQNLSEAATGLDQRATTLKVPELGVEYSQTIALSGGKPPYNFTVSAGSLPTGLTLVPKTGEITGKPTVAGAYSFTISVLDATGASATQAYTGTIASGLSIITKA